MGGKKRDLEKRKKKLHRRFKPIPYLEEYAAIGSTTFKTRIISIHQAVIQVYLEHRNNCSWASCCKTFERELRSGKLGHPEKNIEMLSSIVNRENIATIEGLSTYFIKTMPKNSEGEILLPQINMRHRQEPEPEPEPVQRSSMENEIQTCYPMNEESFISDQQEITTTKVDFSSQHDAIPPLSSLKDYYVMKRQYGRHVP